MTIQSIKVIVCVSLALCLLLLLLLPALLTESSTTMFTASAYSDNLASTAQDAGYDVCAPYNGYFCTPFPSGGGYYILSVSGSWTVPKLTCSVTPIGSATYEVGMDFAPDQVNVENGGGVNFECTSGSVLYIPVFLAGGQGVALPTSSYPVQAGDHMSSKLSYSVSAGTFTLVLHDSTHVWTYKTTYVDATGNAHRGDGLFILTRGCGTSSCPLPDFVSLKTSSDYVTITTTSTATTGTKGSIGHWLASLTIAIPTADIIPINMYNPSTSNHLASPGSIASSTSTGFSITWLAST